MNNLDRNRAGLSVALMIDAFTRKVFIVAAIFMIITLPFRDDKGEQLREIGVAVLLMGLFMGFSRLMIWLFRGLAGES